jgi:competence protein ComEC
VASVAILDVGHGNCSAIIEGSDAVIIDAGRTSTLVEFLRRLGITRVPAIAISHAHEDHFRGAVGLVASEECEVQAVWVNSDASRVSPQWKALLYELDVRERSGGLAFELGLMEGDALPSPHVDVEIAVLAPRKRLIGIGPGGTDAEKGQIHSNSASSVVCIRYLGRGAVLLPGDLDQVGLDHLLDTGQDLRAETLVFPHHGAKTSADATDEENTVFAERLMEAVQPETVVFSTGRGVHGTPRPEIVAAVRRSNATVRIACTQLSKRCADEIPSEPAEHLVDLFAQGREAGHCCGGTILIELGAATTAPVHAEHLVFIERSAPTALCVER